MSLRVAFIGFRHGHITSLYKLLQAREDVEIVAACEEDAPTIESLAEGEVVITHDSYTTMLDEVDCDVVACGDYYSIRGPRLIAAMERGRHVIGDKPLCTRIGELDTIAALAREKDLRVGCMLDLGDLAPYVTLRDVIRRGMIGEVHCIVFQGQHPLKYGSRPQWYFEEGKHGGTLNDIAIHAVDIVPWLTGHAVAEITSARAWNAKLREVPFFQDGAVCMLTLDNGCAVLGDVSYLAADTLGYKMPNYWRMNVAGADGVAETACTDTSVKVWRHEAEEVEEVPVLPARSGGYFEDFLLDLAGTPSADGLTTARVLRSASVALQLQAAADQKRFPQPV